MKPGLYLGKSSWMHLTIESSQTEIQLYVPRNGLDTSDSGIWQGQKATLSTTERWCQDRYKINYREILKEVIEKYFWTDHDDFKHEVCGKKI